MNIGERIIRAVTFIFWETLLFENDGASARRAEARCRNLTQAVNSLGVQVSLEEMSAAISETVSSLITVWEDDRDVACIDQIRLIIKRASKIHLI